MSSNGTNVTKATSAFVKVILPIASRGTLITLGFVAGMLVWKILGLSSPGQ